MYKVMIVDDEILARKTIGDNMDWAGLGYELVTDCQNGKEAIEYLEKNQVDVVLTDINMPFVDGLELSKYICDNCPRTKVIIFSGYNDFEHAKSAIQYRVTEYLLKPVTPKELIDAMKNVKNALDEIKKKESKVEELQSAFIEYTKNESLIVRKELMHLMKGSQDSDVCILNLKKHGIEIKGKVFCVAHISADLYIEGPSVDSIDGKESELMTFVIDNISTEIMAEEKCGMVYRDGNGSVCILFYSNATFAFPKKIEEICMKIKKYTYESMKLSLSIVVGKSVASLQELPKSYEAMEQLKVYKYTQGSGVYMDYGRVINRVANAIDIEKYMYELECGIKQLEVDSYRDILADLQVELSKIYIEKSKVMAYLTQLVAGMCKTVNDAQGIEQGREDERESYIDQIYCSNTLEEGMGIVTRYVEKMRIVLSEMQQSSGTKLAKNALSYIEKHYHESTLGLNEVCEYLNISVSHFSTIYKEEIGETFMETLTRIRMEEAKRLLKETHMKNYEIAERVGFSDPHYFSIAFKKMTGKTPKEFAKENR